MTPKEQAQSLLKRRQQAYARVFNDSEDAKIVMSDLMRFCHFGTTVFNPDQRITDVLIGRQEVLHRLMDYAKLDAETLYAKYTRDTFDPRQPKE